MVVFSTFQSDQRRVFPRVSDYMKQIPIPAASSADKARLTKLAERAAKRGREDAAGLRATEREIDEIVYRLFDLTPDEVGHIEKSLPASGRQGRR